MLVLSNAVIAIITLLVFYIGGYFSKQGMAWYATLAKPSIPPPGWVFSVAWTAIYLCLALCASIVWRTFTHDWRWYSVIAIFAINVCLNMLWTYLFFVKHLALYALIDALALFVSTWALIILIAPVSMVCAGLLFPYGLWLILALFLNWQFMVINGL